MLYDNELRDALERDEPVFGAAAVTLSPVMIEVYADLGLAYVWFDHEHIGPSSADGLAYEEITRAAAAAGIDPIVRIESGDPAIVRKVLDAGIRNLVVPRVETADEVRRAIEAARFSYEDRVGDRGVGTSLASNWGNRPDDYTTHEDATTMVGVMLENATALENAAEILSVPELGFAWIGPADLSISLDHPQEFDHPEVRDAIETFLEVGADAGVPIGTSVGYTDGVQAALDAGYRVLSLGSEVGAARQVISEQLAAVPE